jgi:hypothetical protein
VNQWTGKPNSSLFLAAIGARKFDLRIIVFFAFQSGVRFVIAKTPSDYRSWETAHSKLRRVLGLTPKYARVAQRAEHKNDGGVQGKSGRQCQVSFSHVAQHSPELPAGIRFRVAESIQIQGDTGNSMDYS